MSLKVGDKAPDFTLPSDGGGKVSLGTPPSSSNEDWVILIESKAIR